MTTKPIPPVGFVHILYYVYQAAAGNVEAFIESHAVHGDFAVDAGNPETVHLAD